MGESTIVNLGCGTRTSPLTVNLDWSIVARLRASRAGRVVLPKVLGPNRRGAAQELDEVVVHDLRKGIPFEDSTVDAVYHSHFIEHLDRPDVDGLLAEVFRVLRPGGIHRIVCPDLEALARQYIDSIDDPESDHDGAVAAMYGQSVRREAHGTSTQGPVRRRVENLLLGDARKRGETHQWMWDRRNLADALTAAGYVEFRHLTFDTSDIPNWSAIDLDSTDSGEQYKADSMFVEARKP